MTTLLRYLGKSTKKMKLADAPGYDGKPVEIILDTATYGDTLTMSDSAAKVVMELYPGVFENLTYPVKLPEAPVIDAQAEEVPQKYIPESDEPLKKRR